MSRQFLFSYLTDDEFLTHLMSKEDPTEEDLEAAHRLELLLENYRRTLDTLHELAVQADSGSEAAMERLKDMTAPVAKLVRMQ